jgi:hypothetical protein
MNRPVLERYLGRWDNQAYRLVTLMLICCGLKTSDALRLAHDCVVTDASSSRAAGALARGEVSWSAGSCRRRPVP